MATIELTAENLENVIHENEIVLIDFWAEWCGPCRVFGPIFEKASENHPNVVFAKCNTEVATAVASTFGIRSIPTIAVFREGILLYKQAGALPERDLEELISSTKEIDMQELRETIKVKEEESRKLLN